MFNPKILEILKRNEEDNHFDVSGSPIMLKGGVRMRLHPLPSMDFQPDSLATGADLYKQPVASQRVVGGSMKSVGRSIVKGLKKVGKVVAPIAKDIVVPVVKDFATKQGRKFLTQQLEKFAINDALPVAEEAAPLLLAAGRKRKSSKGGMCGGTISGGTISGGTISGGGRRESRAKLVRKIMSEHGCSLPEASRYIKENGIEY